MYNKHLKNFIPLNHSSADILQKPMTEKTSVGWFLDFDRTFVITSTSSFLKISRIEEPLVLGGFLKEFKKLAGFVKEPAKTHQFRVDSLTSSLVFEETMVLCQNQSFEVIRTTGQGSMNGGWFFPRKSVPNTGKPPAIFTLEGSRVPTT